MSPFYDNTSLRSIKITLYKMCVVNVSISPPPMAANVRDKLTYEEI